jgi:HSP20 family molecular chaperone IbpA
MQRVVYLRRPRSGRDQRGLQQQLERAFQRQWGQPKAVIVIARNQEVWRPPTDVYETDAAVVVKVELPGMRDGEIEVTLDDRSLRIAGSRPEMRDERLACYHQMGINYGAFEVEVFLARAFDPEHVTAHYDDGFLFVELPKQAAPAQMSRVWVQIAEE